MHIKRSSRSPVGFELQKSSHTLPDKLMKPDLNDNKIHNSNVDDDNNNDNDNDDSLGDVDDDDNEENSSSNHSNNTLNNKCRSLLFISSFA